jgi:short-subunit dehydrogenase
VKQVLIIGGGGGLGSALVKTSLDRHFQVAVAGRTRPCDQRVKNFYSIDATDADWASIYRTIEQKTATPIEAMIFVAGTAVFGKTSLIPFDKARQMFELNFWACTSAARAAAEFWSAKGHSGTFLAVLSIAARRAVPFESYYCASRAATVRFLECLQLEYNHKQLEFLCAFPGLLRTSFRRNVEWFGLKPSFADEGADVQETADVMINLLTGKRKTRVIGWRERSIDLADRLFPGLYDRLVLRNRVQKLLKSNPLII